jgi:hypothetical protein
VNFEDDLDVIARLGWSGEAVDRLAEGGFQPGDLGTFFSLDRETRALVLRLLNAPTDEDQTDLAAHPAGRSIAQWLLTLPAYREPYWIDDEGWEENES